MVITAAMAVAMAVAGSVFVAGLDKQLFTCFSRYLPLQVRRSSLGMVAFYLSLAVFAGMQRQLCHQRERSSALSSRL